MPNLKVVLKADRRDFSSEMNKASEQVKQHNAKQKQGAKGVSASGSPGASGAGVGGGAAVAIAAIAAASTVFIKKTLDYADHLADLSDQTNIAVGDLDALGKSANDGGRKLEDAIKMLEEMQESRVAALQGNEGKMQAFNQLGISQDELLNTKNIMELLAKKDISSRENRSAMIDIVGKKNVGVFAVMQQDLADWQGFKDKLSEQGRAISPEAVQKVAEFNDALKEMSDTASSTFLPYLTSIMQGIMDAFYWLTDNLEIWLTGILTTFGEHGLWGTIKDFFTNPKKLQDAFDKGISEAEKEVSERQDRRKANRAKKVTEEANKQVAGQTDVVKVVEKKVDNTPEAKVKDMRSNVAVDGGYLGADTTSLMLLQSLQEREIAILNMQLTKLQEIALKISNNNSGITV